MVSLEVNIATQQLMVWQDDQCTATYSISTAKNGPGNLIDSEQTPLGQHKIIACIGADEPINTVFVSREPTGEMYSKQLGVSEPDRDWILTRILWLAGCEPGVNLGGDVDTQSRYIYIHGCPDSCVMGQPESHGCIRMRNSDIVALFNQVEPETPVVIHDSKPKNA